MSLRRYADAIEAFDRSLAIRASNGDVWVNHGIALYRLNRLDDALRSYDTALQLAPASPEAWCNKAVLLRDLGRFEAALVCANQAKTLAPQMSAAHMILGLVELDAGLPEEAAASFAEVLVHDAGNADALANHGIALRASKQLSAALEQFDKALSRAPRHFLALNGRGVTLLDIGRPGLALTSFEAALSVSPDNPEALNNRGLALQEMGRVTEAIESFQQAQSVRHSYTHAKLNEGLARLLLGDLKGGWECFEARCELKEFAEFALPSVPRWIGGKSLAGKSILLVAEQGLGDTIQFCRYAAEVAMLGARVSVESQSALTTMIARMDSVDDVVARGSGSSGRHYDYQCPLPSLPLALGTELETIPAAVPYLDIDAELSSRWREKLPRKIRPRIGIAWFANPLSHTGVKRSIDLALLEPLFRLDADYFSLQLECSDDERAFLARFTNVSGYAKKDMDIENTAALIGHLDLVVAVDSAMAHLAGALGAAVWVMLPYAPDWRWGLDSPRSRWYPTARLFRQLTYGNWESVVQALVPEMRRLIESNGV